MGTFVKSRDDDERPKVTWSTSSKKDPRFNMAGGASGIFAASDAIDKAVLAKAKELGIEPPDDIKTSAWKR